jgi:hypothetical protein
MRERKDISQCRDGSTEVAGQSASAYHIPEGEGLLDIHVGLLGVVVHNLHLFGILACGRGSKAHQPGTEGRPVRIRQAHETVCMVSTVLGVLVQKRGSSKWY